MRKITWLLFLFSLISYSQVQDVNFSASPATFEENEEITITVSNVDPSKWGVSDIYLWAWSLDKNDDNIMDSPNNGSWGNSKEAQKLINNGNGTYSITFTPSSFYNRTNIGKIGMLVKAKDGNGDKKSQDKLFEIGKFQLTLNTPSKATTIINSGDIINVRATASLAASFNLKANGISIDQKTNTTNYSFSPSVTENTSFVLEASNNGTTDSASFNIIVKPTVISETIPSGLQDGINLNTSDNTKATLVFYAPEKDFIYLIGDFNNWEIDNNYLLKKDPNNNRFWIVLTGLSPQTNYTYQYLIDGEIKVADPYSTVVLTEYNDQYINNITYPDLPTYPEGKTNHAVTLLKTGEANYNWQITNFQKPEKTDLVIYELLIRDFDALHSFDAVKARLDYLQGLGINAIEFMPLNEFDGNLSWGYNPSFHMALDKYYGTKTAFKQLIDECHKRGIAVILDVVYNHATGQNPLYRMYNTDNGGYGGQASSGSPFFNQSATHSYSVYNDLNHSKQDVNDYVKRTAQYWIEEFKIDGFRWDLTKGFTQNCNANDEGCTGNYQQDRVDILKEYADYQWEIDPNSYVIFEHLGSNNEETQWVNYRLNEGKGIMMWGNHNWNYSSATRGKHSGYDTYHERGYSSDFSWISYKQRGWSIPANVSYMESHDEQRLMYENLRDGNSNSNYSVKTLNTALTAQELAGAFYFTVPGPKMIWQFGELGYEIDINQNGRTGDKPILWSYFDIQERKNVYNTWNKLIQLKLKYDIFKTSDFTIDANNPNGLKKIQLSNHASSDIQYINIIGNFGITTQNINPVFQKTGTWYDILNNNQSIFVSNVNSLISLAPGEFRIYANRAASLSTDNLLINDDVIIYPNPAKTSFRINLATQKLILYDINGKKVKEFNGNYPENHSFYIDQLNNGTYFLEARSKKGKAFKKIVKE